MIHRPQYITCSTANASGGGSSILYKESLFITVGLHMESLPIFLACLTMFPSVEAPWLSVASQAFPVDKNQNKENYGKWKWLEICFKCRIPKSKNFFFFFPFFLKTKCLTLQLWHAQRFTTHSLTEAIDYQFFLVQWVCKHEDLKKFSTKWTYFPWSSYSTI